jgi:predicted metal-dependent phosphoesterase TrpH
MRCDIHVHTVASGRVNLPLLRHLGRESYSTPEQVYAVARRRGMDLVTLSDHNTIEGALQLAGRSDTFISEEVSCYLPQGREIHLGVLDLQPAQHEAIAVRQRDAEALFAYLAEQRLPVVLNHPFAALTGRRELGDLELAASHVTHVETPNGMMPRPLNHSAAQLALEASLPAVGGSDAHAIHSVARAWTEVPRARTRDEFLAGLRQGWTVAGGTAGSYATLTRDVATVLAGGYVENARDAMRGAPGAAARLAGLMLLVPILPLVPLITAWQHLKERAFGARLEMAWGAATRRTRRVLARQPA